MPVQRICELRSPILPRHMAHHKRLQGDLDLRALSGRILRSSVPVPTEGSSIRKIWRGVSTFFGLLFVCPHHFVMQQNHPWRNRMRGAVSSSSVACPIWNRSNPARTDVVLIGVTRSTECLFCCLCQGNPRTICDCERAPGRVLDPCSSATRCFSLRHGAVRFDCSWVYCKGCAVFVLQ